MMITSVLCEKTAVDAVEAVESLLATTELSDAHIKEVQKSLRTLTKMASISELISPNRIMLCLNSVLDVLGTALLPDIFDLLLSMHMTSAEVEQALELAILPLKGAAEDPDLVDSCIPAARLALSILSSFEVEDKDVVAVLDAVLAAFHIPSMPHIVRSAFFSSVNLARRTVGVLPRLSASIHVVLISCWFHGRRLVPFTVVENLLAGHPCILASALPSHPETVLEVVHSLFDGMSSCLSASSVAALQSLYGVVGQTLHSDSEHSLKLWCIAWTALLQELATPETPLFETLVGVICCVIRAVEEPATVESLTFPSHPKSILKSLVDGTLPDAVSHSSQSAYLDCLRSSLECWQSDRGRCLFLVGRILSDVSKQCDGVTRPFKPSVQNSVLECLWTVVSSHDSAVWLVSVDTVATILSSLLQAGYLEIVGAAQWKARLLEILGVLGVRVDPSSTGRWMFTVDLFQPGCERSESETEAVIVRIWRCYLSLLCKASPSLLLDVATGLFSQPVCEVTSICDTVLVSLGDGVFTPAHFVNCESKQLIVGARSHVLFAALLFAVLDALQDVPITAWAFEGERYNCVDKLVRTALQSWRIASCSLWLLRGRASTVNKAMPSGSRNPSSANVESAGDGEVPHSVAGVILGEDILDEVQHRVIEERRQYNAKHKIGGAKAVVVDLTCEDTPQPTREFGGHDEIHISSTVEHASSSDKEYFHWFTPEGTDVVRQWCACIEAFMHHHGFSIQSTPDVWKAMVGNEKLQLDTFGTAVMLMDAVEVMIGATDALLPDHIGGRFWRARCTVPIASAALLKFPTVKHNVAGTSAYDVDLPPPPVKVRGWPLDGAKPRAETIIESWLPSGFVQHVTQAALFAHERLLTDAKVSRVSTAVLEKRAALKTKTKRLEKAAAKQAWVSEKAKAAESAAFRLRQGVGLAWVPTDVAPVFSVRSDDDSDDSAGGSDEVHAALIRPVDMMYSSRLLHVIGTQLWALLHRIVACMAAPEKSKAISEICVGLTGKPDESGSAVVVCFEALAGLMCRTPFAHIAVWVCELLAVMVVDSTELLTALGQLAAVCLYDVKSSPAYRIAEDGGVDLPLAASQHRMRAGRCCLASFISGPTFYPTLREVSFGDRVEDPLRETSLCYPVDQLEDASLVVCFSALQKDWLGSCAAFWQLNMLFRCVSYQPWHVSETALVVLLCHAAHTVNSIGGGSDSGDDAVSQDDDDFDRKRASRNRRRPISRKELKKAGSGKEKSLQFWSGLRSVSPDTIVTFVDSIALLGATLLAGCPFGVLAVNAVGGVLASSDKLSVDELLGVRIPIVGNSASSALSSVDRTCVRLRRVLSLLRLSVSLVSQLIALGAAKLATSRGRIKQACGKIVRVASEKSLQIHAWRPSSGARVSSKDVRPVLCDLFMTAAAACDVLNLLGRVASNALSEIRSVLTTEGIDDPAKHATDLSLTPTGDTLGEVEIWKRLLLVDEAAVPHWQSVLKDMQNVA